MSNYTDQELESAVSQYIRDEVQTEREDLGQLSADHAFTEVREFVASTLVYDPSSIFYLLTLAANRVNQDVLNALVYLDDVQTAIQEMGRYTTKVTKTSLLEDAAAALLEVDRVLTDKNAITERGLSRYRSSLDKFTSASLTPNIRQETGGSFPDTYQIVRPPQKAQSAIKESIASLRDAHTTVLAEAAQLAVAMDEFVAENLPLTAIQTSVGKVRTDLRALKSEFDAASTEDDAISLTRDAYLRIAAGESVMTNLSSISDPRDPRMQALSNTADRAQAAYGNDSEGTAAQVAATISAPWELTPTSNQLILDVDGAGDVTIDLPVDEVASIAGNIGEYYDIHGDQQANLTSTNVTGSTVPASPNNVFDVYIDGVGYRVTLTPGYTLTGVLATAVNGAARIDGAAGTLDDVATALNDSGYLRIEHDTAGLGDVVIGDQDVCNTALGFVSGQDSDDLSATRGLEANDRIQFLVDDTLVVEVALTAGPARTAAQVADDISTTSPFIGASVAVQDVLPTGTQNVVEVQSTSWGAISSIAPYPTTSAHEASMETLGFYPSQSDRAGYTDLGDVASAIEEATPLLSVERDETEVQRGADGLAREDGGVYYLDIGPVGTLNGPVAGDSLRVERGSNVGWYRVVSLTTLDGGTRDALEVERPFPVVTGSGAQSQVWSVQRRLAQIVTVSSYLSTAIEVKSASANSVLGLPVGEVRGTVTGLKVLTAGKPESFTRNDVRENDWVTIGSAGTTTTHQVLAVTEDGYQLELTPQVSNDVVGELYKIESEGDVAYDSFIALLDDWLSTVASSQFSEDILALERVLNPLLTNKNPSTGLINDASNKAAALRELYTGSGPGLKEILEGFTVTSVERIDSLLDMLLERGLGRAHDQLLLGQIANFFGMTKDGASYGGSMLEAMRSIAQEDVPQSRDESEDHVDSRLISSVEEPDADLDFSDQDDETGITETDDIPDPDEEDAFLNEVV